MGATGAEPRIVGVALSAITPPEVRSRKFSTNGFEFEITGNPIGTLQVQASDDLWNWRPARLLRFPSASDGPAQRPSAIVLERATPAKPQQFYRAVSGQANSDELLERWLARGFSHYRFRFGLSVFGPSFSALVTVTNGVIEKVEEIKADARFGNLSPDQALPLIRTVDKLFGEIGLVQRAAASFVIEFDPQFGFPSQLSVDQNGFTADDEYFLSATDFAPLDFSTRLTSPGALDYDFLPGLPSRIAVRSLAIHPDGKLLAGTDEPGYAFGMAGSGRLLLLQHDGAIDKEAQFAPDSVRPLNIPIILPAVGGKWLIGNSLIRISLPPCEDFDFANAVVELTAAAQRDSFFNVAIGAPGITVGLGGDGIPAAAARSRKLLNFPSEVINTGGEGGFIQESITAPAAREALVSPGSDRMFMGCKVSVRVSSIAQQADGKVLVAGDFQRVNFQPRKRVVRLNPDGSLDAAFDPDLSTLGTAEVIAVQPDGKIILAGSSHSAQGTSAMARFFPDGRADSGFASELNSPEFPDATVRVLLVWPDGRTLAAGSYLGAGQLLRHFLVLLDGNGRIDPAFDSKQSPNGQINALALLPKNRLLVAGSFTEIGGAKRSRVAVLESNGKLNSDFDPMSGPDSDVYAVAVEPDGSIVIGGSFRFVDGVPRNGIARLHGLDN